MESSRATYSLKKNTVLSSMELLWVNHILILRHKKDCSMIYLLMSLALKHPVREMMQGTEEGRMEWAREKKVWDDLFLLFYPYVGRWTWFSDPVNTIPDEQQRHEICEFYIQGVLHRNEVLRNDWSKTFIYFQTEQNIHQGMREQTYMNQSIKFWGCS